MLFTWALIESIENKKTSHWAGFNSDYLAEKGLNKKNILRLS